MSRLRTIKPGFFVDEELAECDMSSRILFAGLWCIADRAGRLEDRPKRIKVEILPYDDCDVDGLLNQLQEHGFIIRYSVDLQAYIQIVNFQKHQSPHINEPASTIQAPEGYETTSVQAPEPSLPSCLSSGVKKSMFDDFWIAYPKKVDKQNAIKVFCKLTPNDCSSAVAAAVAYGVAASGRDLQFEPGPAKWLRGRRWEEWENGPPPGYGGGNGGNGKQRVATLDDHGNTVFVDKEVTDA